MQRVKFIFKKLLARDIFPNDMKGLMI